MSDLDQNSKVDTSTDGLSQRRREILKGSAVAIPAILTLRSGSALAAGSLTCQQKVPNGNPPVAAVDSLNSDNWLRTQTICRVLTEDTKSKRKKTKNVYRDPSNFDDWYEESTISTSKRVRYRNIPDQVNSKNGQDNRKKMVDNLSPKTTYLIDKDNQPCYVLIQVGSNGKPTGLYGASDPGTFPFASNSCETSLINRP